MELIKQKLNIGALGLVVCGLVLAGTNTIALKFATGSMDPLVYAGIRALAIGLILFLFVGNYRKILSIKMLIRVIPGVLLAVAFFAMHAIGVSQSGALKASFLSLTIPVFVYIFAITLLHEPLIKRIFLGGIITLIGSALMIGLPVIFGNPLVISDTLLLLAYACLAASIIHAKYMFRWLTTNELLSARFLISGILLVGYILLFQEPSTFLVGSSSAWLVLLYSIVVVGIVGNTLYYRGLTKVKAEQTAPFYFIEPTTGVLLAAMLLGETLDLIATFGVMVVLVGVAVSYPHHHYVLHNYLVPHNKRLKRILHRLAHPIRG